jgi:glycosyltransferase involved in cell wall biosynthesis
MTITIGIVLLLFSYTILIGIITVGWYRTEVIQKTYPDSSTTVSIVLAARNEEQNIGALLQDLIGQEYPKELLEIIVVDDHSDDYTSLVAGKFNTPSGIPVRVFKLQDFRVTGKKAALDFGIRQAKGKLIMSTDADCRVQQSWVRTIAGYYEENKPAMILAPVQFERGFGLFGMFQELEFMSLIATTAGSAKIGIPLMANGANLAYSKEAYLATGGFSENMRYPSGDDVFLMSAIKKKYGGSAVQFLKSQAAVVTTRPEKRLKDFFNQRIRWVSKSRGYKDIPILISSSLVLFTNILFLLLMVQVCFHPNKPFVVILFYIFKLMIDLPVMIGISRFQGRQNLIWLFPILEVINAVYISVIGFIGNRKTFTWKGRRFTPNM